ncbi:class I SAM-dependent methyltransferase [Halomarina halobia]|uniref:Class I SAM-dependent methyltransferase n=1 Tax=Halomarina halobia TaxID=3033386 RepID=A0ABD6A582_9EURY|nr:class I SAM-dependent methyltransferase [Halomarina sp. PSR21]
MSDWDADRYDDRHGFVSEYGRDVLDLLAPERGERVLDLGCGTGHLTAAIADAGAAAVGVDRERSMLAEARAAHPGSAFVRGDVRALPLRESFDAVFSNAALHWVPEADAGRVVREAARVLRPGGRFVVELGGAGNVESARAALRAEIAARGLDPDERDPWYFPSVGTYATVLERAGFEVTVARLFDRPTELDGRDGLREWLRMFAGAFLDGVSDPEAVVDAVEDRLSGRYDPDREAWTMDYRRLRVAARLAPAASGRPAERTL